MLGSTNLLTPLGDAILPLNDPARYVYRAGDSITGLVTNFALTKEQAVEVYSLGDAEEQELSVVNRNGETVEFASGRRSTYFDNEYYIDVNIKDGRMLFSRYHYDD